MWWDINLWHLVWEKFVLDFFRITMKAILRWKEQTTPVFSWNSVEGISSRLFYIVNLSLIITYQVFWHCLVCRLPDSPLRACVGTFSGASRHRTWNHFPLQHLAWSVSNRDENITFQMQSYSAINSMKLLIQIPNSNSSWKHCIK